MTPIQLFWTWNLAPHDKRWLRSGTFDRQPAQMPLKKILAGTTRTTIGCGSICQAGRLYKRHLPCQGRDTPWRAPCNSQTRSFPLENACARRSLLANKICMPKEQWPQSCPRKCWRDMVCTALAWSRFETYRTCTPCMTATRLCPTIGPLDS